MISKFKFWNTFTLCCTVALLSCQCNACQTPRLVSTSLGLSIPSSNADSNDVKQLVKELAPVIQLHPDEKYNPMDPRDFIRLSRLRHNRSGSKDQGWSKEKNKWVGGIFGGGNSRDKEYYDIPLRTVNGFGLMQKDGQTKNRRPRDENRSRDTEVFLEPEGEPRGVKNPNESVPVFYDIRKATGENVSWDLEIQYWYFFGYNEIPGAKGIGLLGNHQGDWESVILYVSGNKIVKARFKGHGAGVTEVKNKLEMKDGRLVVYIAKGTHASYPHQGRFHTANVDHTTSGGMAWRTWENLLPLQDQPWKDYAGAWGRVGEFSHTTGPLGPWLKRFQ